MGSLLVHAFHSYHFYFLPHSQFPCFHLFIFFVFFVFSLFTSLFSLFSFCSPPFVVPPFHCTQLRLFYTAYCGKIYHFYPSTTFGLLYVSFPDCPLVCWLPSQHHYPMLAMPRFIPIKKLFCFVFLLLLAFSSR